MKTFRAVVLGPLSQPGTYSVFAMLNTFLSFICWTARWSLSDIMGEFDLPISLAKWTLRLLQRGRLGAWRCAFRLLTSPKLSTMRSLIHAASYSMVPYSTVFVPTY